MGSTAVAVEVSRKVPVVPSGSIKSLVRYEKIDFSLVHFNPKQPRKKFDQKKIENLSTSFRNEGLLQAPIVKSHPTIQGHYELMVGERRFRALQALGVTSYELGIWTGDPDTFIASLIENIHREQLNPIEVAESYRVLRDEKGMSLKAIGELVGVTYQTVSSYLRLLDLPPHIQQMIIDDKLPKKVALNFSKFKKGQGYKDAQLIRMAHELMNGITPMEMQAGYSGIDEREALEHRLRGMRLPTNAEELLARFMKEASRVSSILACVERLGDAGDTDLQRAWNRMATIGQRTFLRYLDTFVQVAPLVQGFAGRLRSANEHIDSDEVRRAKRERAFGNATRVVRLLLYEGINVKVNLGRAFVIRQLRLSTKWQKTVDNTVIGALRVVGLYWYHTPDDTLRDQPLQGFLPFITGIKDAFKVREYKEFLARIRDLDDSDDPIDITEAEKLKPAVSQVGGQ
ncbi:MAG: hypothetical protein A3C84_04475 [Candidatus Ryanbacteria bacterium RIFCSPHIGHO2_02_FULL_48_12]|uniref:HTH cro/C1-type domain-containing protein n=1 Tax=Candidatus Ryanbacteria bacterium RIFCSPHIGHO2_01_FULL_48_27 TaxID=1802115 RepID=A0A1G2G735_9BACT|nr:MAG: hypothetical protein A2756_02325 [Candidatus Ryanbacteria bacterium RIFCSPHIGHO2_01_FULL_48_27]OGZ49835.1 MAG: hypothetical protein A3C84_04475 [Candidatus Ryanbacteria bacterium RIFCSPHIGHO2_02_FULL_48_12]